MGILALFITAHVQNEPWRGELEQPERSEPLVLDKDIIKISSIGLNIASGKIHSTLNILRKSGQKATHCGTFVFFSSV